MLIIPAIDIKDGRAVRLEQGDMAKETVFSDDPAAVAEYPALEHARRYERDVPRGFRLGKGGALLAEPDQDWPSRWEAAGGTLTDDGRMVALKSDPIWQALGDGEGGYDDTLGNDFPPFAFNSGYGVYEIQRDEAIELGLMNEDDEAAPAKIDFANLFAEIAA